MFIDTFQTPRALGMLCKLLPGNATWAQGYHVFRLAADLRDMLQTLQLQVRSIPVLPSMLHTSNYHPQYVHRTLHSIRCHVPMHAGYHATSRLLYSMADAEREAECPGCHSCWFINGRIYHLGLHRAVWRGQTL